MHICLFRLLWGGTVLLMNLIKINMNMITKYFVAVFENIYIIMYITYIYACM